MIWHIFYLPTIQWFLFLDDNNIFLKNNTIIKKEKLSINLPNYAAQDLTNYGQPGLPLDFTWNFAGTERYFFVIHDKNANYSRGF